MGTPRPLLRYLLSGLMAAALLTACKKDDKPVSAPANWYDDWTLLPTPPHARFGGGVLGLRDGRLLYVGGRTEAGGPILGTDLYSPTTRTWTSVGGGLTGTGFMFEASNGDVFAYGGNSGGGGTSGFIYRLPSGRQSWDYLGQIGGFGTGVGIWGGAEISGNRAVFCGYKQLAVWTGDSLKLAPNNYNPDRFYGATLVTLGFNTPAERLAVIGGFDSQRNVAIGGVEVLTPPAPGTVTFGASPQQARNGSAFCNALALDATTLFLLGGKGISGGTRSNGIPPFEVNVATQTGVRRDSLIGSTTTSTISQENSVTLLRRADGQLYGLDPVYFNVGLYNPTTRRWRSFPYSGPYIDNPGLTVLGNALVVNVGGVLYSRTF